MKVNELRIGNYYYQSGSNNLIQCTKLNLTYYIGMCDKLEQIPLTKDWLLKFGFIAYESEIFKGIIHRDYRLGNFVVILGSTNDEIEYAPVAFDIKDRSNIFQGKLLVHQLQSLYFALTDEELEIKTS